MSCSSFWIPARSASVESRALAMWSLSLGYRVKVRGLGLGLKMYDF